MSDLDIGMNDWMCPDLKWDDNYVPDRGKVYTKEEIEKLEKFHRYLDVDGDGIPYRTLPGVHPKGAYFTRGSGHTQYGVYTEDSAEYQIVLDRLTRKFTTAKRLVPKPVIEQDAHIDIAVVAYGSSDGAVREALDILAEHGIKTNYMRLRVVPVRRGSREIPRAAEAGVRHRAEPRRADALAAHARDARAEGEAALAAALQRPADFLRVHRQGRARGSRAEDPQARSHSGKQRRCRMTFLPKPKVRHPSLPKNSLGLTRRDYEGGLSTLCAGCGHDSITAAIIEASWGLDIEPQNMVKLSGIGCSSKTTAYFVSGGHGFNSVHGRMPSIAMGANAANRNLTYIGVSGDGDTLSIGLGQFCHAIRRNLNMAYIIENNGVYGLTKGQFSASADVGTKAKKGEVNQQPPIDPVLLALTLGATFVARSFSGDKQQLVPLIQAALAPQGFRADRRPVALRHVQRSRGIDEELSIHARALRRRRACRLRAVPARDLGGLRRGRCLARGAA